MRLCALEPWNEIYWGLLSNIQIEQGEWKEALKSAESGLEMAPEDGIAITCEP